MTRFREVGSSPALVLALVLVGTFTCDSAREAEHGQLVFELVATLGAHGAPVSIQPTATVAYWPGPAAGAFVVGPTYEPGVLAVFSSSGEWSERLGGHGDGPGEMRTPMPVVHIWTDARWVWVLPLGTARITRFSSYDSTEAFVPGRRIRAFVPIGGDAVIVEERTAGTSVLALIRLGDLITREPIDSMAGLPENTVRVLGQGSTPGTVWVTFTESSPEEPADALLLGSTNPPQRRELPFGTGPGEGITGIWDDGERLWVTSVVRRETQRPTSGSGHWDAAFDTRIRVVSLESWKLLSDQLDPRALFPVRGMTGFAHVREHETGELFIDVLTARLVQSGDSR